MSEGCSGGVWQTMEQGQLECRVGSASVPRRLVATVLCGRQQGPAGGTKMGWVQLQGQAVLGCVGPVGALWRVWGSQGLGGEKCP